MCLQSNDKETGDFRVKKAGQTITVWKVYDVCKGKLLSPIKRMVAKIGIIKSNRRSIHKDILDDLFNYCEMDYTDVHRGIHVFLTRKEARRYRNEFRDECVFKCTADVDDLIGVDLGDNEAVFMQIHLTREEAEKGKKGRN